MECRRHRTHVSATQPEEILKEQSVSVFVLEQIAESAKKVSFSSLNSIMDKVFPQVATSMELGEMLKYAKIGTSLKIALRKDSRKPIRVIH